LLSIVLRGIQRFFAISFAKHEGEELVLITNKKSRVWEIHGFYAANK